MKSDQLRVKNTSFFFIIHSEDILWLEIFELQFLLNRLSWRRMDNIVKF